MSKNPLEYRAQHTALVDDDLPAIEASTKQIPDSRGDIGSPIRVVDTLALFFRRGIIIEDELKAGRHFEERFATACLNGTKAVNLHGNVRAQAAFSDRAYAARDNVYRALTALGGFRSLGGQVAWHVLGLSENLNAVAERMALLGIRKTLDEKAAKGALVTVLGTLSRHYGFIAPEDLKVPELEIKRERVSDAPTPPHEKSAKDLGLDHGGTLKGV